MLNLSRYRILAIGKIKKDWIQSGISVYLNRLKGLTITELRDSTTIKEASAIRSSIKPNELLILLNEKGIQLSSLQFAERLNNMGNQRLVFAIGGANGLHTELQDICYWNLSLSPLTFPHELARLILVEQIYRAQSILTHSPYHRS